MKRKFELPTAHYVRSLLRYDEKTGFFTWIHTRNNRVKAGDRAGTKSPAGYIYIVLDKRRLAAHRLAILLTTGAFPEFQVDHKNGVKCDNWIDNLRDATPSQNQHNKDKCANNKSGKKGVSWVPHAGRWKAQISINGRGKHLGYFDSVDAAHAAYTRASAELHGQFARAG